MSYEVFAEGHPWRRHVDHILRRNAKEHDVEQSSTNAQDTISETPKAIIVPQTKEPQPSETQSVQSSPMLRRSSRSIKAPSRLIEEKD